MKKFNFQASFQSFAGGMMIPIIVLVVCGLLMGFASPFANFILEKGTVPWQLAKILMKIASLIIHNVPLWFVIGITFGLSRQNKGYAALAGIFMLMAVNTVIATMASFDGITAKTLSVDWLIENRGMTADAAIIYSKMFKNVLGVFTYDTSIFGSIVCGILTSWLMNKWDNKTLPNVLGFFAGPKFIILLVPFFAVFTGIIMFYMWPIIGGAIQSLSRLIGETGLFGTFLYGVTDRALLPIGLHHLVTLPLRYTELGGSMLIDNFIINGTKNIEIALTGSADATGYLVRNFTSGRIPLNLGAWPGAALAMYVTCKPENRKKMLAIVIPAVFTATFVGVTEPIEFTTLFASPMLYFLVHVPLAGLSFFLTEATEVSIQGFAVIFMLPNILQPEKVHALSLLILIPTYFALYFFIFRWAIVKFDLKTPGRSNSKIEFASKKDMKKGSGLKGAVVTKNKLEEQIVTGLGGRENIVSVENCATRLRVQVKDPSLVVAKEIWVEELSAMGFVSNDTAIQVIYGPSVTNISSNIKILLGVG